MEDRKKDHIELAFQSQTLKEEIDSRFIYEPLLKPHNVELKPFSFLGKEWKVPLWVSSMTGGTKLAGGINKNLAQACNEFGMGMGLGSCRILLDDDKYLNDFNVRPILGKDLPLWANLGISQIEKFVLSNNYDSVHKLLDKLQADGLIIHVNPMQEWLQPEGDRLTISPIESIRTFLDKFNGEVIVKEVGQGMGPESLRQLLSLPLEAIEFASFGGTNFAKVELLRRNDQNKDLLDPLSRIGNTAEDMVLYTNWLADELGPKLQCKQLIISGGINNYLDGYYYMQKSNYPAVIGMASAFLKHAQISYESLQSFIKYQIQGLQLANSYLSIR